MQKNIWALLLIGERSLNGTSIKHAHTYLTLSDTCKRERKRKTCGFAIANNFWLPFHRTSRFFSLHYWAVLTTLLPTITSITLKEQKKKFNELYFYNYGHQHLALVASLLFYLDKRQIDLMFLTILTPLGILNSL